MGPEIIKNGISQLETEPGRPGLQNLVCTFIEMLCIDSNAFYHICATVGQDRVMESRAAEVMRAKERTIFGTDGHYCH
jgi:hypothetical protein